MIKKYFRSKRFLIGVALICSPVASTGSFSQVTDWAIPFKGFDIRDMQLDDHENIYLHGKTDSYEPGDVDPGPGVHIPAADIGLVVKLDSTGQLIWAKNLGYGSLNVAGNRLYMTGTFFETTDFDPGPGVHELSTGNNGGLFLVVFDLDGNFINVYSFDQTNTNYISALTIDLNQNIYLAGTFAGTLDADPGTGIVALENPPTGWYNEDGFIIKLDSGGTYQWSAQLVSPADQVGTLNLHALEPDKFGNIYASGFYLESIDFDSGTGDAILTSPGGSYFLLKMDTLGNYQFVRSIGDNANQGASKLQTDSQGNIYLGDVFRYTDDFDPTAGVHELTVLGGKDVFVEKFDSAGNMIWVKQWGGIYNDYLNDFGIDENDDFYLALTFSGTCDVNGGPDILEANSYGYPELETSFDPSGDYIVQKLDTSGDILWTGQVGNLWHDNFSGFEVANANTFYLSGVGSSILDLQPGSDTLLIEQPINSGPYHYAARLSQPFDGLSDLYVPLPPSESSIYPNPTTGELHVYTQPATASYDLELLDETGRIIFDTWIYEHSEFDISALKPGVYFLYLRGETETRVIKIVKI